MIYNISAGAIELPQVPEYRPSHCLHRAAPAPAMRRLSICWLAKQFDSAEVTRKEPARINTRNTPAKRRECCGSRSFENALRRCGGIAAGAAATDSFAPPKTFRTDTLRSEELPQQSPKTPYRMCGYHARLRTWRNTPLAQE